MAGRTRMVSKFYSKADWLAGSNGQGCDKDSPSRAASALKGMLWKFQKQASPTTFIVSLYGYIILKDITQLVSVSVCFCFQSNNFTRTRVDYNNYKYKYNKVVSYFPATLLLSFRTNVIYIWVYLSILWLISIIYLNIFEYS